MYAHVGFLAEATCVARMPMLYFEFIAPGARCGAWHDAWVVGERERVDPVRCRTATAIASGSLRALPQVTVPVALCTRMRWGRHAHHRWTCL